MPENFKQQVKPLVNLPGTRKEQEITLVPDNVLPEPVEFVACILDEIDRWQLQIIIRVNIVLISDVP